MFKTALLAGVLCCWSAATLLADFTYEQNSKITGGMMAGMMKVAGAFSKQAREPMRSTVVVKGDRMAILSSERVHIIDLNKETMTDVDMKNKTYSVITFADMAKAMAKMAEKSGQKDSGAEINFKFDVKNTGASRQIAGFDAKQKVLTIVMEGTDKKSGQTGEMSMVMDMWLAPSVAGYDEVRNFYMKMGQKLAWTPGSGMLAALGASQPGMGKGFAELYKEASKLDGVPVLQVVRMGGASGTQAATPTTAEEPSKGGRLGGLAGLASRSSGLGGFGRKKATEQEQPQGSGSAGTLIELTTEMTSFSSAAVDESKFEVPADFKQVESEMQKALNR